MDFLYKILIPLVFSQGTLASNSSEQIDKHKKGLNLQANVSFAIAAGFAIPCFAQFGGGGEQGASGEVAPAEPEAYGYTSTYQGG